MYIHTHVLLDLFKKSIQLLAVQSSVLACYTLLPDLAAMLQASLSYNPSVSLFYSTQSPSVSHTSVQAEYQGVPTGMLCQLVLPSTKEDDYQYL